MNRECDHLLIMEDVVKCYPRGDGTPFTVLNDIDLRVQAGEFVTVVGPSGCGKSTLLRLVLGSESPTRGRVSFAGKRVESPDRDRGIVFQKYSLFPHFTVLENLVFGLFMEEYTLADYLFHPLKCRKRVKEFRETALEYLRKVDLEIHQQKYPHQLSGGQCQRVAIAQSLMMKPRILLMDEPFGALDYSTRQDMQRFILEQWREHEMTIFFVTHDLEEAVFLGTRTLVLTQYYRTDLGKSDGAKIVTDLEIPGPHPKPTTFRFGPVMEQMMEKLRRDGLEPDHCRHISEFDLRHADSFRTVSSDEWKQRDEKECK